MYKPKLDWLDVIKRIKCMKKKKHVHLKEKNAGLIDISSLDYIALVCFKNQIYACIQNPYITHYDIFRKSGPEPSDTLPPTILLINKNTGSLRKWLSFFQTGRKKYADESTSLSLICIHMITKSEFNKTIKWRLLLKLLTPIIIGMIDVMWQRWDR